MGPYGIAPRALEDAEILADLGWELNLGCWLLTCLAAVFLALRVYCKFLRGRQLWWDDYLLVASWLSLVISAGVTSACIKLGYDRNTVDVPKENTPKIPFLAVCAAFFATLAAACSKTSFGLTLIRLCQGWTKYFIWFLVITMNIIIGATVLLMWVTCRPLAESWDMDPTRVLYIYEWSAGWSGSCDVLFALLPWAILFGLRHTLIVKERVGIAIAMSMGIAAGVASFVRMAMLLNFTSGDLTKAATLGIWGAAEGAITIVAASIPVLRTLIRGVRDRSTDVQFNTHDERRLNTTSATSTLKPEPGKVLGGAGALPPPYLPGSQPTAFSPNTHTSHHVFHVSAP